MATEIEFYIVYNDYHYDKIVDIESFKEIDFSDIEVEQIKYVVKKIFQGYLYRTSYGATHNLYTHLIYNNAGDVTTIKHFGAQCNYFEEVSKSMVMGSYSIAEIADSKGIIAFKGFPDDGISFVISVIKLVEQVGESESWEEYDYKNGNKKWIMVDKDLKIRKYLKPIKYRKNNLYWVKEVYTGRTYTTSMGNIYPLYEYKILGSNLKPTKIKYFDWICDGVYESYKSFSDCVVNYGIWDRNGRHREQKFNKYDSDKLIIELIEEIKKYGKSGDWNVFDLKEKDYNKYLEETMDILSKKVIEYEKARNINPISIEKIIKA
ncbi:MAG: hypothetical protein M0Q51_15990 [Bacteroidales bacterium]|nr:hypothetical protein [Bacteroidales bacterium]